MPFWSYVFLILTAFIWLRATKCDKMAAQITFFMTLTSSLVVIFITVHITSYWKLLIPTTIELITVLALLYYTPNRTGYFLALSLIVAGLTDISCILDIIFVTNYVYDQYERIIAAVAICQILAFYDTISYNFHQLGHWCVTRRRLPDVTANRRLSSPLPIRADLPRS